MSRPLSNRAYAEHRKARGLTGGTHRAVGKAIEDGRISEALIYDPASGRLLGINAEVADRLWSDTTLGSQNASTEELSQKAVEKHIERGNVVTPLAEKAKKPTKVLVKPASPAPKAKPKARAKAPAEIPEEQAAPEAPQPSGHASNYAKARSIKESYEAQLKKLEYDEKSGKLIAADKVRADCYTAASIVREALLNMPARMAPELASVTDTFEVERILRTEIHGILELCSREFEKAGAGSR